MPTLVAIDSGYSYMKAISENGKKVLYPNMVASAEIRNIRDDDDNSTGNFNTDLSNNLDVIVDHKLGTPKRYFVGNKATTTGDLVNTADRLNEEYGRTTALTALALLAEKDDEEFIVSTGLPITHFKSKIKDNYIELFPGEYSVKFMSGPLKGTTRSFKVLAVRVYEQGMGCFFDQVLDNEGNEVESHPLLNDDGSVCALIDIGSQTTNFALYRYRQTVEDGSDSINVGIKKIYPALKATLAKEYPDLGDGDLDWLFKQDQIGEYNIKEVRDAGLKSIVTEIQNKTNDLWIKHKLQLTRGKVYIGGGGGTAAFDFLPYNNKVLIKNAQFANARGFLKILTLAWKLGKVEV